MGDHRIALKNDTIISFGDGKDIRITGEIGRGASCIVYDAVYSDDIGVQHFARVKECYPSYPPIDRNEKNHLVPSAYSHEKFETTKRDFVDAYKCNAKIRSTLGLINSTVNSTAITSCNHTVYTKMELDEGIDYKKYEDPSLKSLFTHIKSLAELIRKYHQNGYLYLDIKPENIFILPETDEHIILFDFDSVITLAELAGNTWIELSFSKGFSPPEQVEGKMDKIGKHTDIYSIGALAFYKLFNRTATFQECKISSTYPFGEMKYANEKYHPRLYRALNTFFKKTLSIAIAPRWHDMQPVIDQLDELIKLSDVDEVYLLDSFQYDSACFVGRNEEIEEIADILATNQLVFLSGIGGIGKTELAKQYANKYHSQYDTVTFSVFEKNIETLVCDEILIHKVERDENESDSDYFKRKIGILKQVATPRDLVIIDNFDVDSDDKLEILFRCPCKFIITTRMDFSDYNYKQVYVDRLRGLDDVLELFYTYNNKDYQEKENEAIEKLVDYVDRHTMTVELIAKYLRNSEESPADLYGKFLQKEGTSNTREVSVKQRKDFALRSKSVNDHLRILFDVSGFDPVQKEMIRSLSLLAGIRIEKSKFHALCAVEDGENKLGLLIRDGWVEYQAESGKISLHQVIQDLVYMELAPDAENCPRIVEGMDKYVDSEAVNETESEIKRKLFEIFMERLSGNTLPYAKLCLKYGKENKLDEAEEICFNCYDYETIDLLQRIQRKKINIISKNTDYMSLRGLDKAILNGRQKLSMINTLLDNIKLYCQKSLDQPDYIAKEYIEAGIEVHSLLCNNLQFTYLIKQAPELDSIYKKIIEMFDIATNQLPSTSFSRKEKIKLYNDLERFYSGTALCPIYIKNYFIDPEKTYRYQKLIMELNNDTPIEHISCGWMSNYDVAKQYEKKGEYQKAITYYKKESFKKCIGTYERAIQGIMRVYSKIGNIDMGITFLEQTIAEEDKQGFYHPESYIALIKNLAKLGQLKKATEYAKQLIYYEKSYALSDDDPQSLNHIIFSYYFLYTTEKKQDKKHALWQKCLKYYNMLGDNAFEKEIYGFIAEYTNKNISDYEEIANVLNRISRYSLGGSKIIKKIILQSIKKYAGKKEFEKYHVMFLLKLGKDGLCKNRIQAQKAFEDAEKYYNKYRLDDKYLQNLIYKEIACFLYDHDNYYEYDEIVKAKKMCDYKLLAEQEISDHALGAEEQVEIWKNTASEYEFTNDYNEMLICLHRAFEVLKPLLSRCNFDISYCGYQNLMEKSIDAYIQINDFNSAYRMIIQLYDKIIECLSVGNYFNSMTDDIQAEEDANTEDESMDGSDHMANRGWLKDKNTYYYYETQDLIMISNYFMEISKFDDAIRTYFVAMYFVLVPTDTELLKIKDDISADLVRLCVIVDRLLDQELTSCQIDALVDLKDHILECKNLGMINAKTINSITSKISEKYQYKDAEFKR